MPRKHRHSSEGSDLTGPTSGPHYARRESRGTMLGDRTRLLARLGGSSQKRRILPVKVLAKLPGPGDVVAARRSRPTQVPTFGAIPCTPGVTRRNARGPGMANYRAGASPTR